MELLVRLLTVLGSVCGSGRESHVVFLFSRIARRGWYSADWKGKVEEQR